MQQPAIHVSAHCHAHFPGRDTRHHVKPWLHDYYRGVLKPYGALLDADKLTLAQGNDFLSMGSHVLRHMQAISSLQDIAHFFVAHQTPDTFYPMRSTTSLLCQEFGIAARACALTEYEASAPYAALKILLAVLRCGAPGAAAMLLVLDQAILPHHCKNLPPAAKLVDSAVALKFSCDPAGTGPEIRDSHVWIEDTVDPAQAVDGHIRHFLDSCNVPLAQVHVVADESLRGTFEGQGSSLPFASYSIADARFMSCAGLLASTEFFNRPQASVLLVHLAEDGHFFQFLFSVSSTRS